MTYKFKNIYIENYFRLVLRNEHNLKVSYDKFIDDYYLKSSSVEMSEAKMQIDSIKGLINKSDLSEKDISLLISSDLQNQLIASTFAFKAFDIPSFATYSACASFTINLLLASKLIKGKKDRAIVTVSSHNLVSEKQFRYPIEYGAFKKKVSTFTTTASVSTLVSKNKSNIMIESATIGKVVDIGYNDLNNFGAVMAPSAAKTIYEHLKEMKRNISYYDVVLTGDLGMYGKKILKDYILKEYNIKLENIIDCGEYVFENPTNAIAGGSGPVTSSLVLYDIIEKNNYKNILLVATGSLHSKLTSNLNEAVPSVSHIVSLKVIK